MKKFLEEISPGTWLTIAILIIGFSANFGVLGFQVQNNEKQLEEAKIELRTLRSEYGVIINILQNQNAQIDRLIHKVDKQEEEFIDFYKNFDVKRK